MQYADIKLLNRRLLMKPGRVDVPEADIAMERIVKRNK
jgi:hypothetical protein